MDSFNDKNEAAYMRDEFLNGEIFTSHKEANVFLELWRIYDHIFRPHRSLIYKLQTPVAQNKE